MPIRFDLTDLRLFLCIAEASNITRGAARASMTLASASERIRAMENELGTSLLVRKARGVELTPAGSALLHHARLVIQQLEHMRGEMYDYARGLRTHVHLRCVTVGISEFLPQRLATFLSSHPNIDVELEEGKSREIVRAVAAGGAQIGIVTEGVDRAAELETIPFAEYRLVVVVPPTHQLARARQVHFRETLGYEMVGLRAGSALQEWLNEQAARAGKRIKLRLQLDNFDAICRLVESRIGAAIVPEPTARRWHRRVRIVPLTDAWAHRHLTLCVQKLALLPRHAQTLVSHLTSDNFGAA